MSSRLLVINMPADVLSTGEHFALEVRGDSMTEAGILDGDIALIKKTDGADTGIADLRFHGRLKDAFADCGGP